MKIVVSNNYEGPLYEQIKRQILHAVITGELLPGDSLPSLRTLARELGIGVLTINRAYTELEEEGYLETVQGKGCFVADRSSDLIRKRLMKDAGREMKQAVKLARKAGACEEDIVSLFRQCLDGKEKNNE